MKSVAVLIVAPFYFWIFNREVLFFFFGFGIQGNRWKIQRRFVEDAKFTMNSAAHRLRGRKKDRPAASM